MGHKSVTTTHKINNVFGLGTVNKHTVLWWFKICKGEKSLEDKSGCQWSIEKIIEVDPLTTTQEVAEELISEHFTVIQHLKLIGKVKKLSKWVPHELTKNQKNSHFDVLSSLILCSSEPVLRLSHTTKSGFYTTTGNDQLSGWTEKFQSQTCTKEWSGSLFGGLLPVLSTTDF